MKFPATRTLTEAMKDYFSEMLDLNEQVLPEEEIHSMKRHLASLHAQLSTGTFIEPTNNESRKTGSAHANAGNVPVHLMDTSSTLDRSPAIA